MAKGLSTKKRNKSWLGPSWLQDPDPGLGGEVIHVRPVLAQTPAGEEQESWQGRPLVKGDRVRTGLGSNPAGRVAEVMVVRGHWGRVVG